MAFARPIEPFVEDLDDPLIETHPSTPVVTVAMATKPASHLRSGDRRRLARHVSGAERRLSRIVPATNERARVVRQLWSLADRASRGPAREGLALIASGEEGRHLTLRHSVTDRVLVGAAPSYEQIVEETWGFGRLAVLRLDARSSRLICADGATLWEPRPPWDPLGLQSHIGVERAETLIRAALPGRTPLMIAGDDRLVRDFCARGLGEQVVGVLAGDHSETSAATLAALAQRTMRRSLNDQQRSAMVSLALAINRGSAARGPDAVATAAAGPDDTLLVEVGAQQGVKAARRQAHGSPDSGARVVQVPDGFLAHHDRVALAPDHRPHRRGSPPSRAPVEEGHSHDDERHLVVAK